MNGPSLPPPPGGGGVGLPRVDSHGDIFSIAAYIYIYIYMKSLIPKGAKSTFVTSEKNVFLCVRICTRVCGKPNIECTISSFCSLYSDQKCVLKVGGKLNNVVILVTLFWSKTDLAPFGIKLFIYRVAPPQKNGQPMWTKFDHIYWYHEIKYLSRSKLIPKYPDLVEWFLIDRHISKQWSDYNYDHGPHGTRKEQDLLFYWLGLKAARIM